jgi:hypothetical protein
LDRLDKITFTHKGCGREISERMRGEDQLQLR